MIEHVVQGVGGHASKLAGQLHRIFGIGIWQSIVMKRAEHTHSPLATIAGNDVSLLQLQEDAERATGQIDVMGVENEAILGIIQSGLRHVQQLRNVCRLIRQDVSC